MTSKPLLPFAPELEGKRLYLMRHGKTYEPHLEARVATPEDDPELPLTEDGRAGVEDTSRALAHLELGAAFSSSFRRSIDTATIVARPHSLTVHPRPELSELRIDPGPEGTMRTTVSRYIEISRALADRPPSEVALDSGLSVADTLESAFAALRESLAASGERTLVVAHGGMNRLLLTAMLGIPLHRFLSIDQDFACVNVIEFVRRGRPWVRGLNLTIQNPFKHGSIEP